MSFLDVAATYDYVDYEEITVSSTAVGCTSTKVQPTGARKRRGAWIVIKTAAINYRMDPDAASVTTSTGIPVAANGDFTVDGHNNLSQLRMIAQSGDATALVHYYE